MFVCFGFTVHAQDRPDPDPAIRKDKVEYVAGSMSLTAAQMQRFLPLYNKYCDELFYQRKAIKALEKNPNSQFTVNERQKLEMKTVEIKGRYKNDFLKIISAQQLEAMYRAEGEFKQKMIERYKNEKK
jgi:hypothetical protein